MKKWRPGCQSSQDRSFGFSDIGAFAADQRTARIGGAENGLSEEIRSGAAQHKDGQISDVEGCDRSRFGDSNVERRGNGVVADVR